MDKAYREIIAYLKNYVKPSLNERNHKLFFSSYRKYIVFLSKGNKIREALEILQMHIENERGYYGKFHINLAKSYELKGKLLL